MKGSRPASPSAQPTVAEPNKDLLLESTERIQDAKPAVPRVAPSPPTVDQARIRTAVRELLLAIGENPDREGLLETPARFARLYAEAFGGLHADPRVFLRKTFE